MTQGFTLIELVVVISIVTIVVALVLPRVWFLQRQTRIGNLNYVRGAVQSLSTLVHSALLVRNGVPDGAACVGGGVADNQIDGLGTVCTEHGLVRTRNGYPASIAPESPGAPGILAALGIGRTFNATSAELRARGYEAQVVNGVTTLRRADAPTPAQCSFSYTESLVARTAASISQSVLTGC